MYIIVVPAEISFALDLGSQFVSLVRISIYEHTNNLLKNRDPKKLKDSRYIPSIRYWN